MRDVVDDEEEEDAIPGRKKEKNEEKICERCASCVVCMNPIVLHVLSIIE